MPRAKSPRNGNVESKTLANAPESMTAEIKINGKSETLESEIRVRAYELYERRGREPGHESEDWFVAEREVIARHGLQTV